MRQAFVLRMVPHPANCIQYHWTIHLKGDIEAAGIEANGKVKLNSANNEIVVNASLTLAAGVTARPLRRLLILGIRSEFLLQPER